MIEKVVWTTVPIDADDDWAPEGIIEAGDEDVPLDGDNHNRPAAFLQNVPDVDKEL